VSRTCRFASAALAVAGLVLLVPSCRSDRGFHSPVITGFDATPIADGQPGMEFTVRAEDADGDSLQFWFDFGDGSCGWLDSVLPSPAVLTVRHDYAAAAALPLTVRARDGSGNQSEPWRERRVTRAPGALVWFAVPGGLAPGDSEPVTSSPIVLRTGSDTVVIVGGCDDSRLYSLRFGDGRARAVGSPAVLDEGDFGHPVYSPASAHVICGNEDGRLYAFSGAGLVRVWMWPPDTSDFHRWTAVAVYDHRIYGAKENDTLYCVRDTGAGAVVIGRYHARYVRLDQAPPVIDNAGDVVFATESCFIYKLDPYLTAPRWVRRLPTGSRVNNLCLDPDANVCATTDDGKVYSLDATSGEIRWTAAVDPHGDAWYMAIGENDVLYVGTGSGRLVGIDCATGVVTWTMQVTTNGLDAGLAYTTRRHLYALDDEDWLYCIDVSGAQPALVWKVNCPAQVGSAGRSPRMTSDDNACLSLGPDGDIIVVGREYAFRVSGYTDGLLATTQWPKWQRDLYNTGRY